MKRLLLACMVALMMVFSCEPVIDPVVDEPTVENTEKGDFSASTEDMIPEQGYM